MQICLDSPSPQTGMISNDHVMFSHVLCSRYYKAHLYISYKTIDHIKQLINIDTYYIVLSVPLFPPKSVFTPAPGWRQFSPQLVPTCFRNLVTQRIYYTPLLDRTVID